MTPTMRAARPDDVPHLLELYKLLEIVPEPRVTIEAAQARFTELTSNPRHLLYVAEFGGRIVGTFAMIFIPGLSHTARDSCVIEDVVVAADVQGSGVGKKMMALAMETCAARDCYKLVLSSHVNRESAHRFYEGLGFSKHGYSYLVRMPGS